MNTKRFFWGFLFIAAGVLWLIEQFGLIAVDYSYGSYVLPLVLVFWGISFLKVHKLANIILSSLSGVIVAYFIFGLFSFGSCWNCNIDDEDIVGISDFSNSSLIIDNDEGIKFATLDIDGAAGHIYFDKPTDKVIECYSNYSISDFSNISGVDSLKTIELRLNISKNSAKNEKTKIHLNKDIIWEIDFESAANKIDADLSEYKVKSVNISSAVSDFMLKIGSNSDSVSIEISSALSNIDISIPSDYTVRVDSDNALTNFKFDNSKDEKQTNKNKIIFINSESGLSNIKINKY